MGDRKMEVCWCGKNHLTFDDLDENEKYGLRDKMDYEDDRCWR